ncbi:MAG: hypothetical protein AAGC93_03150 [Cyanobacteria bacterium P01_F01_bin.53]
MRSSLRFSVCGVVSVDVLGIDPGIDPERSPSVAVQLLSKLHPR